MGHLRADERTPNSPPLPPPHRRSGGKRAVLIIVVLLLTEAALVRGTFAVYDAMAPPPPPIPQSPPPARGLTPLKAPDPTAGTLPPSTSTSLASEAQARATLRTDGDPSGSRYARGLAASTVGQVFSSSSLELCTATVVESPSERVAITAAHCVYWPPGHPEYNPMHSTKLSGWTHLDAFVPGRTGDRFPYGKWPVEGAWVDPVWQHTADPRYDVAFLRLGTRGGVTPQRALGAEGVVFDSRPTSAVTVLDAPVLGGQRLGTTAQRLYQAADTNAAHH